MAQDKYPVIDIVDFPSDSKRIFSNCRKELLLSLRKCRRHPNYVTELLTLLDFVKDVAEDARGKYETSKTTSSTDSSTSSDKLLDATESSERSDTKRKTRAKRGS